MVPKLAFNYNAVPKIRFGVNCLKFAKNDLTSLLGDRIMVITDPGLMELGLHLPLLKTIEDAQPVVFDEVEADPSFSTVLENPFELVIFLLDIPRNDICDDSSFQCAIEAIVSTARV